MSVSKNLVIIAGNLTKDPELKFIPTGNAVCKLTVAVNHSYKSGNEWKKKAVFLNVIVWGKTAENCSKFLSKGKNVMVEGRLDVRTYENADKQKKYITEIVADKVDFLSPRDKQDGSNDQQQDSGEYQGEIPGDDNVPY